HRAMAQTGRCGASRAEPSQEKRARRASMPNAGLPERDARRGEEVRGVQEGGGTSGGPAVARRLTTTEGTRMETIKRLTFELEPHRLRRILAHPPDKWSVVFYVSGCGSRDWRGVVEWWDVNDSLIA